MGDRWNVFVTRRMPEEPLERLRETCDVEVFAEDRQITHHELVEKAQGRDAVLCLLSDPVDATVLRVAEGARIVANYAVGYNNIDLATATELGIMVTNTPDVLTEATAELAWALLFAAARRVAEGDRFVRAGQFHGWDPLLMRGMEVTGKTLGVIGAGRIATAFAEKAQGFKMPVLYFNRRRRPEFEAATGGRLVDLPALLREADFVSLHVPLTPDTRHLLGETELKLMKPTAILINTARGPVVDEQALISALRGGVLWAAGLDVYEDEPLLAPGLADLDNVVLLPHLGSATFAARLNMGHLAVDNILAALRGEMPSCLVNPSVYSRGNK